MRLAILSCPSFTSSELYDASATVSAPGGTFALTENAFGTGGTMAVSTSGTAGGADDGYYWLSDKVGTQHVSGREHRNSTLLRYPLVAGSASADGCL